MTETNLARFIRPLESAGLSTDIRSPNRCCNNRHHLQTHRLMCTGKLLLNDTDPEPLPTMIDSFAKLCRSDVYPRFSIVASKLWFAALYSK